MSYYPFKVCNEIPFFPFIPDIIIGVMSFFFVGLARNLSILLTFSKTKFGFTDFLYCFLF